jgi:hypothetical protein
VLKAVKLVVARPDRELVVPSALVAVAKKEGEPPVRARSIRKR